MQFCIKDFFSKCDQIRRKLQVLVTFTEEILNAKLHFLCNDKLTGLQKLILKKQSNINPFVPSELLFTPCKLQKTVRFSDVFREQRK